jgi:tRNA dimethylallyltransferase
LNTADSSPLPPGLTPLVVVLGPTASGKSDLSLFLAQAFEGEIVNCDSIQVYRGLDVGSAKVPLPARQGIPHYLVDVANIDEELTAGAYARLARPVLGQIRDRHRLPIVVGGTGLYLRALLDGLSPAPERNEEIRSRLRTLAGRRPGALSRFLRKCDPQAAVRIHPNDHQKLIRAIEMVVGAGRAATETQNLPRQALTGFSILKLGLDPGRRELYEHLNARTVRMFAEGLLDETKSLLDKRYPVETKALQSLGYKQALQVLLGTSTLAEAIEECQTRTRQYAKRQMTWFRREHDVLWLRGFGTDDAVQRQAAEAVKQRLQVPSRI